MSGDENEPSDADLDERYVLNGDPEEALRHLLSVPAPVVEEAEDD